MVTKQKLQFLVAQFADETPLTDAEFQILVDADCILVGRRYGLCEMSLTEYGKYVLKEAVYDNYFESTITALK